MRALNALLVGLARLLGTLLVRLDAGELRRLPRRGPFILAMNHVNFLDGPLLLSRLFPRRVVSLAKKETWDNPLLGLAASAAGAIPLDRGGPDPAALRRVSRILEAGGFLYINPEGTRSGDGVLGRGKPGAVALALHSGAPVIPLAFEGLEGFGPSIRRLRRVRAALRVGEPFEFLRPEGVPARELRAALLEELMLRIAALLPEAKRGSWRAEPGRSWRYTRTLGAARGEAGR